MLLRDNLYYSNEHGELYNADCLTLLPFMRDGSADTIFADPPFNLGKIYSGSKRDDKKNQEYIDWCRDWIVECIRILKPGGALFIYNLPKWNIPIANILIDRGLNFRHWISIDFKALPPIPGKLYPAHYSLLYFTKGKPQYFNRPKISMQICRHCGKEIKDYGGYRKHMPDDGVNLSDIWTDISPIRHKKHKNHAFNELNPKILERILQISTEPGDVILDPFGGSGTTFHVAEKMHRRWIGIEVGDCEVIKNRLER